MTSATPFPFLVSPQIRPNRGPEECVSAAPGVGLEPTTYGLTVRRSAN
jgi:hypothetical protein